MEEIFIVPKLQHQKSLEKPFMVSLTQSDLFLKSYGAADKTILWSFQYFLYFLSRVEQQKNGLLMEKNEMSVAVEDLNMEKVSSIIENAIVMSY